jgi:hypothetical protein
LRTSLSRELEYAHGAEHGDQETTATMMCGCRTMLSRSAVNCLMKILVHGNLACVRRGQYELQSDL